jgi:hypothetical protein
VVGDGLVAVELLSQPVNNVVEKMQAPKIVVEKIEPGKERYFINTPIH